MHYHSAIMVLKFIWGNNRSPQKVPYEGYPVVSYDVIAGAKGIIDFDVFIRRF